MFKFMSSFNFQDKQYWLYKRASVMYYSTTDLGEEIESGELTLIKEGTKLSDFVLSLSKTR